MANKSKVGNKKFSKKKKKQSQNTPRGTEDRSASKNKSKDSLLVQGVVKEVLPGTLFKVEIDGGHVILAHLSGKMRLHFIKILPGDRVKVAISPYDLEKGRITFRESPTRQDS